MTQLPAPSQRHTCKLDAEGTAAQEGRAEKLKQVAELEHALQGKQHQLAQHSASDPQRYEALRKSHAL